MTDADLHTRTEVGPRLRALRHEQALRLADLATITGIAASTLSRLETGQLHPTLAQLLPLARAFDVTLDELVGFGKSGGAEPPGVIHRHGAVFMPLAQQPGGIQTYKMYSPARSTLPQPDPCRHEGFQWLYVLSGRLRVVLDDRDFVLSRGEAAEFDAGVPHWMGHADHDPIELLMMFGPQGEKVQLKARAERVRRANV